MRFFQYTLSLILICFFITSCSTSLHKAQVSPADFKKNNQRIIVTRLGLPEGLRHKEQVRDIYAYKIAEIFRQNGFEVIEQDDYFTAFNHFRDQEGGFFDPVTGAYDDVKFQSIKKKTLRRLSETHKADAVVYYEIRVRTAAFGNYRAEWDGQSEPYEKNNSDTLNFLSSLVNQTSGKVGALSLFVEVENMTAENLYWGIGGVQLISKLGTLNKFESVPDEELLANDTTITFSVHEALRKLLNVPAT